MMRRIALIGLACLALAGTAVAAAAGPADAAATSRPLGRRLLACVDTFAACPGWAGQCAVPGVATYCPCMCGSGGGGGSTPPTTTPPPSPPPATPPPTTGCVDTYPACPGWKGQCAVPGVATYCPCMCGSGGGGGSTPPTTGGNKCDKCNIPVTSGGCKCDSNCDCISTQPPSGTVLYSGNNIIGTYYYDVRTSCPQDPASYPENNGYPRCTSDAAGPAQQTIAQVGSNNIVAIDNNLLSGNRARLCGKKVLVYKNGVQIRAPDGGDFFVWDGCAACIGGGKIDFSVSGARAVDPAACTLGLIPGVSFKVVDEVVKPFVP